MENKTRRIRKTLGQGLDAPSKPSRGTNRRGVSRSPTRALDLPPKLRVDAPRVPASVSLPLAPRFKWPRA